VTDSVPTTAITDPTELGDLLLEVLPLDGSTLGNLSARQALSKAAGRGIGEEEYDQIRDKALLIGTNGTKTSAKFCLRSTAETLADLSRPIDPRHLKTRKQGGVTLTYCSWNTIAKHLHHRAPGWC
jgi:hypothetical protein